MGYYKAEWQESKGNPIPYGDTRIFTLSDCHHVLYAKSTQHAINLIKAGYPNARNVSAKPLNVEGD